MKKKFQRKLKKRCPDCESELFLTTHIEEDNGVSYMDSYEECEECGYIEKISNKRNRNNKIEIK
jgi:ribosomal protein S27AE